MSRKNNILFRILLVLYLAAVLFLCFGHFSGSPGMDWKLLGIPSDKVVHFLMFFPFPLLVFAGFDRLTTKPWHSALFAVCVFLAGCLLAAGTEIGQTFTTYRNGDVFDFKADTLALALSSILVLIIDLRKQHTS